MPTTPMNAPSRAKVEYTMLRENATIIEEPTVSAASR